DRSVPHGEETWLIVRGLASAPRPTNGLTGLHAALFRAIVHAMLGLDVDVHALEPVEPDVFAGALARRDRMLHPRLVQHMELLNLVLQPLDQSAARRVQTFAEEPCVGDERVQRLRALAEGSLQLAAHDFDRNRYLNRLVIDSRLDGLRRPSSDPDAAHRAWTTPVVGDDVAAGWRSLRPTAIQTRSGATSATSTSCAGSRFRHAGLRATLLASTTGCMSSPTTAPSRPRSKYSASLPAPATPPTSSPHADELRRDLGVLPTSPGNDRGRQRPALASRRHEARRAGRGSEREGANRHHVPRASEAGAMTAKPCDPTATAQEERR
ncbi:MAG: hypothetical protein ACRDIL_04015, partial [Candidatus Limnocylindrales bacterium]